MNDNIGKLRRKSFKKYKLRNDQNGHKLLNELIVTTPTPTSDIFTNQIINYVFYNEDFEGTSFTNVKFSNCRFFDCKFYYINAETVDTCSQNLV